MNAREYFERIYKEGKRLQHLNTLLKEIDSEMSKLSAEGAVGSTGLAAGETYRDIAILKQSYEAERKDLLARRREAESLLGLTPFVDGAQIVRRRYLYGWTMEKAAHEVGYSERGAGHKQNAVFKWIDEQMPIG